LDHLNPGAIVAPDTLRSAGVHFYGCKPASAPGQQARQRSFSRAYLHHGVAGLRRELADDPGRKVPVDEKVLTERLLRCDMLHNSQTMKIVILPAADEGKTVESFMFVRFPCPHPRLR